MIKDRLQAKMLLVENQIIGRKKILVDYNRDLWKRQNVARYFARPMSTWIQRRYHVNKARMMLEGLVVAVPTKESLHQVTFIVT